MDWREWDHELCHNCRADGETLTNLIGGIPDMDVDLLALSAALTDRARPAVIAHTLLDLLYDAGYEPEDIVEIATILAEDVES